MAKQVFSNPYVSINSVDLSNRIRSLVLNYEAEMVDATTSGTATTREKLAGMKDWSLEITFAQDYAAANVDATLFPLLGTSFAIEVRPTQSAVSATNPKFTGTGVLVSYQPVGGNVGDLAEAPVRIEAASALTRATS